MNMLFSLLHGLLTHLNISLIYGLLMGFAFGSGNNTRSLKIALLIGFFFATLLGGFYFLSGNTLTIVACSFCGIVFGSIIAAYTPNENRLKRFLDLS